MAIVAIIVIFLILALFLVALTQYSEKRYYKEQYHDMMRKCNDLADENHHLKVKYGLLPIFSYDVMED